MNPVWQYVVYPAVLAGSDSAAADGIVLTVRHAVQTKLNQDNFLLLSGAEGAGPYRTLTKERRPRLTSEKQSDTFLSLSPHFVVL